MRIHIKNIAFLLALAYIWMPKESTVTTASSATSCEENQGGDLPWCYCDRDCINYSDCCPNSQYLNLTKVNNSFDYMNDKFCIPIVNEIADKYGAWIIDRCGKALCTRNTNDLQTYLIVTDENNKSYLNEECARCNGATNFTFWDILLSIEKRSSTYENLANKYNSRIVSDANLKRELMENGRQRVPLEKINPPRFCYKFSADSLEERKACPKHQTPLFCKVMNGDVHVYRNCKCASTFGKCEFELSCTNTNQSTPNFPGTESNAMKVLFQFSDLSGQVTPDSLSPSVLYENVYMKFLVQFIMKRKIDYTMMAFMQHFIDSLLLSLYYHSGYKLYTATEYATVFEREVSCSGYLCYQISFELLMISGERLDKEKMDNIYDLKVTLSYSEFVGSFEKTTQSLVAKMMAKEQDDNEDLGMVTMYHYIGERYFYFEVYSNVFPFESQMHQCSEISIVSLYEDEYEIKLLNISTKCARVSSHETHNKGLRRKQKYFTTMLGVFILFVLYCL